MLIKIVLKSYPPPKQTQDSQRMYSFFTVYEHQKYISFQNYTKNISVSKILPTTTLNFTFQNVFGLILAVGPPFWLLPVISGERSNITDKFSSLEYQTSDPWIANLMLNPGHASIFIMF